MKNFIQLYKKLVDESPHLSTHNFMCANSDYSDQLNESKNAYLCFNGYGIEDCMYTYDSRWNKDCLDMSYSNNCELCCDCTDTEKSYNGNDLQDCENCADCSHCYDCFSCQNCTGCVGLRQKRYHIFNEPYEKEDYFSKVAKLSKQEITAKLKELSLKHPHVAMHTRKSENSFGDYIFESKNAYYSFKSHGLEDCSYMFNCGAMKDSMDTGMLFKSELIYEAIEATDNYNCNFMYWCANCTDCEYIMYCFNCTDCFGCFNLKHKKYHILNMPYEKEEYLKIVAQIKEELRAQAKYNNFLPDIIAY